MLNKVREEKGITLVVLIITIIGVINDGKIISKVEKIVKN